MVLMLKKKKEKKMNEANPYHFVPFCIFPGPEEVETKCPLNHIACLGDNKCVHLSQMCNGVLDCSDGYDEGVHCRGESTCRTIQLNIEFLIVLMKVQRELITCLFFHPQLYQLLRKHEFYYQKHSICISKL